uniref:CDC45-like protein n=1 Tax=Aureoumbra lagunensis TaxID=44058 RepID=A0A7S3K5P6_9STRA|mmetsp:Transcript_42/g.72  ORF Transcript_42/g.72 Transcript_42/m.72 type:complete len:634 (+) Transcript_42:50-1951(+)
MLLGRERFEDVYTTILETAAEEAGSCSVVLFVAPDCDALCACRLLTTLLKQDNVVYKVLPVSGYSDIAEASQNLDASIRSVIMINCGAMINIGDLILSRQELESAQIYVLDHHRPIHIKNAHNDQVIILDSDGDAGEIPSDGDDGDSDESESDEEEEDSILEDEVQEDFDEEEEADDDNEIDADVGDSSENQDEEQRLHRRRRRRQEEAVARKEMRVAKAQRRERRRRIDKYYDATYDATPSSMLGFALCEILSRAGPTEVWLAALGLASVQEQWRISDTFYEAFVKYLARSLRQMEAPYLARAATIVSDINGNTEPGRIVYDGREPRFMLHRHLALFESMYYSNYVAARLSVWKKDGKQKLKELLARMGVSIDQSRQKVAFLPPSLRRALAQRLEEHGPRYGLDRPFRPSLGRLIDGCGDAVAATDAAACVSALLEAPAAHAAVNTEKLVTSAPRQVIERTAFVAGFWRAYDATLANDINTLAAGVDAAIDLQKAIVSTAVALIEKRDITTLKHFRYCYLHAAAGAASEAFTQAHALRKLAIFLFGIHKQNGKWTGDKERPILILAERHQTFLVIGVQPNIAVSNNFGQNFRLAVDHIKADYRADFFDTNFMEVRRHDVQRFIESLHYLLSR